MSDQETYRHISPEEFAKLDFGAVTLLDLREPDQVLLNVINESMEPLIKTIIEEREKFFQTINKHISEKYSLISGKETEIRITMR